MNDKLPLSLKDLPSWLGIGLLWIVAKLPIKVQLILSVLIGTLSFHLLKRRKQIVLVNLSICFPELDGKARNRMAKQIIASSIQGGFEMAMAWWSSDEKLHRLCEFEGKELLEKAREDGRGVLLLGLHFTTLDLAGRMFSLHHDVDVTYRVQNNAVFNYFILKYRRKFCKDMIEKTEMKRAIKNLKAGHVVWYAIDQNYGRKKFVFAPFFGQPAATLATTGRLLKMTNAQPLLFTHYRVIENGQVKYKLSVTDPFNSKPFTDDEQANAEILNAVYEEAVRKQPEQYMWGHRRFKTRRDNFPSLYPAKKRK